MPQGYDADGNLTGAAAVTAAALAEGLPNPYEPPPPPLAYPPETKIKVLELLADGQTFSKIEQMDGMPNAATIRYWRRHDRAFASAFARAHEDMGTALVHRAMEAADDAKDRDTSAAGRVKAETYLKIAAMLDPGRYAPKQTAARVPSITIVTNLGGADQAAAGDGAYTITLAPESVQDACSDDGQGGK